MSYDNQYSSLTEAWGRVPKYSKYSAYQSDKNEYGKTFTSFEPNGPQLDRDFRRNHEKEEDGTNLSQIASSRQYTYPVGSTVPTPPIRTTIPKSSKNIIAKNDEYLTKLNYGPEAYPNVYTKEYFTNPIQSRRIIKFYNRAILVLLFGLFAKWVLDQYHVSV
jgi:hypothetical protein